MIRRLINISSLICIISIIAVSCGLFSTRTPENPSSNNSDFEPATKPEIVISNFINSLVDKNVDNYVACFSDTSLTDKLPFQFVPSTDANIRYSNIFSNWNILSERRYFSSLFQSGNTPIDVIPSLRLSNNTFEYILPDSAVYLSDYILNVDNTVGGVPKVFSGTMQLILYHRNNGIWSIQKWIDTKTKADSTNTWSILKALFTS